MRLISNFFILFYSLLLVILGGCVKSLPTESNDSTIGSNSSKAAMIDTLEQLAALYAEGRQFDEKYHPGDPPLEELQEHVLPLFTKMEAVSLDDCPDEFKDAVTGVIQADIARVKKRIELQSAGVPAMERAGELLPLLQQAHDVRERLRDVCRQFELGIPDIFRE